MLSNLFYFKNSDLIYLFQFKFKFVHKIKQLNMMENKVFVSTKIELCAIFCLFVLALISGWYILCKYTHHCAD